MWKINGALVRGKPGFSTIMPGFHMGFAPKIAMMIKGYYIGKYVFNVLAERKTPSQVLGEAIGSALTIPIMRTPKMICSKSLLLISSRRRPIGFDLGATQRTLIDISDCGMDKRIVKNIKVVYHDANKAGKHLDIHIGHMSITVRIDGKPVEKLIEYDKNGWLTEKSKQALIEHLRNEFSINARMVHNHDHTVNNASCSWPYHVEYKELQGYGMGATRQIILNDSAEMYHIGTGNAQHWYIPSINKHQGIYIYQIYPGETPMTRTTIDNGKAPILICGFLSHKDINFEDRLHLTMISPKDEVKFLSKVEPATITRKYDGAGAHFIGNESGFEFFSPRISKETGHRISYTGKMAEMSCGNIQTNPVGMGELMFWKYTPIFRFLQWFGIRGPEWITWKYISAAESGGILNSDKVRPRNVWPELRVYRIDKWNSERVIELPFFQNRILQETLVNDQDSDFWKTVELAKPGQTEGWEGLVGVAENDCILNGYKIKWLGDEEDWTVTKVNLGISEKGNIMGVVWFINPDNKPMKLGPGQLGNFDDNMDIIDNPNKYIGRTAKVVSRVGHSGRAAKLQEWHLDK